MKFFLVSMVCLVGAVLAQPGDTRQKRDVLPGDPRYGGYHVDHPPIDVPVLYGAPALGPAARPDNTYLLPQDPIRPLSNVYVPAPAPRPVPVPRPVPAQRPVPVPQPIPVPRPEYIPAVQHQPGYQGGGGFGGAGVYNGGYVY